MSSSEEHSSAANILCKACGLCCTGHLFAWAKLRASEMDSARDLGLHVLGTDPKSRGFSQPCPLWDGECTIYSSAQYPHFCGLYKCKLLKNVMDGTTPLPEALTVVEQTKARIGELDTLLPASSNPNFRERLLAEVERNRTSDDFPQKVRQLLASYKNDFGVRDLIPDLLEETESE